jgi:hypothetical protein
VLGGELYFVFHFFLYSLRIQNIEQFGFSSETSLSMATGTMVIANVNRQNNADCISYNFNLGLESFVGKKLDGQKLSIFDIHAKQNISVINETKQDEISIN